MRATDGRPDAELVIGKTQKLNNYFRESGLKAAVVAVSGGVDSALVLQLVHYAASLPGSPIARIVPVLLPVFDPNAATGQDSATARGAELCKQLGLEPLIIDLTPAHQSLSRAVSGSFAINGGHWAMGQLVAYSRTPALYYITSLLSQEGLPAVLVGTTNYDEGAYLGYFGKASDGMVDLQLISDLHKSEVYSCAKYLGNLPISILNVAPTGDMYDGRLDEEVFGAPYEFVELYLRLKRSSAVSHFTSRLPPKDAAIFTRWSHNLEELHRYNAHKYLGKSPAIHLDILNRFFEGSWDYAVY